MLMEYIRERAQSWISWLIIGFIIIVFAVWGINAYFEPESVVTVAKVNDTKISLNQYQRAYEMRRSQLQAQFGGKIDPALFDSLGIKGQVLQQLVDEEAQLQATVDAGYRISDAQLAANINQIQAFQTEGRFDKELYEQTLSRMMTSPTEWEMQQRRYLLLDQPLRGVVATAFVTDSEIKAALRLRDQQREIGYGVLPLAKLRETMVVSDDEIQKYYESNRDRFQHPEQVKVEYVELSLDQLASKVDASDAVLRERYEQQKASFSTEERRKASHILIGVDSGAEQAAIDQARAKADEVLAKVKAGEPFEKLAETYSEDPGSAKQGGDLGFFGRGVMDKAFEDAAFALEKGAVSDLVRSGFGFHIIKLTDIEASQVKPFDEVKAQLAQDYRRGEAETQFYGLLDQLETLSFEHPDNLQDVAQAMQLSVKESDWFGRASGNGVAQNPKVREAAFADDVLTGGNNSAVIEVRPSDVVVLRIKEHKAATPKTLDEVRAEIAEQLKGEQAAAKLRDVAKGLLDKLRAGGDADATIKEQGGDWKRPGFVGRDEANIDHAITGAVFESAKPSGGPVFGEVTLANGDVAVFGVYGVRDGDPEKVAADEKKVLADSKSQSQGQAEFRGVMEAWKKGAKIATYPDKI